MYSEGIDSSDLLLTHPKLHKSDNTSFIDNVVPWKQPRRADKWTMAHIHNAILLTKTIQGTTPVIKKTIVFLDTRSK